MGNRAALGSSVVAALGLLIALLLVLAPPARAVPEHSFDATLSLEGGCEGKDGVPDPGCPEGQHPPKAFDDACGTAVDRHGYLYVASAALGNGSGTKGRIDVFNPKGEFLTEIADEHQPCSLAVDSEGNLYVAEYQGKDAVAFAPESYPPKAGEKYSSTIVFDRDKEANCKAAWSVAVDPANDHLYLGLDCMIAEYGSAAEGWPLLREGLGKPLRILTGLDVSGQSHDIYVTSAVPGSEAGEEQNARLYVLDGASGNIQCEVGGFSFRFGFSDVGVDQANGDAYVDDMRGNGAVRQFDSGCGEIGRLPSPPVLEEPSPFAEVAVDDPCLVGKEPCNPKATYDSPNEGYVFVGSGFRPNESHLYAYAPKTEDPPIIEEQAVGGASESEATLEAKVNPKGSQTTYHFEYVSQAQFEAEGYTQAISTPEEAAGASASPVAVAAPIAGLLPGTAYRFRVVASNCASREVENDCLTVGEGKPGQTGTDASFATYSSAPPQSCPNEALRTGPSASLPDCRAYELVTPPQTNGRIPTMTALGTVGENGFTTELASADGTSLIFGVEGGSLPGSEGSGFHDTYRAQRGPDGWQSEFNGLRGTESSEAYPGGIAPDHRYSFFYADIGGAHTLAKGNYLRGPDGAVEPIGIGSLGSDLNAIGKLITAGGTHVIFISTAHLEEAATANLPLPAKQTTTIYDRAVGGPTQVISLLPGEITPTPGSDVKFQGISPDASTVAFKVEGTLYLRRGGATQEVAAGDTAFGGLSQDGGRLTYLQPSGAQNPIEPPHGEIFSYDAASGKAVKVSGGDEAILVNVSADGSHLFFVSPNPGTKGLYDLYAWDTATQTPGLIATVTERDVFGEETDVLETMTDGLGLWVNRVQNPVKFRSEGPGADPSRTTTDGSVFLFESRAPLTPYDNRGRSEIYRYSQADGLSCLSCNPTGVPAKSDARLQGPIAKFLVSLPPLSSLADTANLSADGRAAFFESAEPLVGADNDAKIDVYEWEAAGRGGCERPAGCLALISSGHSAADDRLYAVSPDGHDVFIETADPLAPTDPDGGHSIYDAREGGGFAAGPAAPGPCQGADACRAPFPPPSLPGASSGPFAAQNASPSKGRGCPKGKHKARRGGKARCLKSHNTKHRPNGRAAR